MGDDKLCCGCGTIWLEIKGDHCPTCRTIPALRTKIESLEGELQLMTSVKERRDATLVKQRRLAEQAIDEHTERAARLMDENADLRAKLAEVEAENLCLRADRDQWKGRYQGAVEGHRILSGAILPKEE